MRVAYAVPKSPGNDANFLRGLTSTGVEVIPIDVGTAHDVARALGPDWTASERTRLSEHLLSQVRHAHARQPIDILFAYLFDNQVEVPAILGIRDLGITTVNYWCNSYQFDLIDEISPAFDFCAVAEWHFLDRYRAVGAKPVYMQMAADPEVYRPYSLPRVFDATFVGQRYGDRPVYVAYLLKNGIDVRLWGPGWTRDRTYGEPVPGYPLSYALRHPRATAMRLAKHARSGISHAVEVPPWEEALIRRVAGPSLPLEELVKTYSRSHLSLGFSTVGDQRYGSRHKIRQVHMRDFEAPMSGACYFTEHQEELSLFYRVDEEIITYRSREELLEKVRYYLAHPDLAEAVRRAGHARASRDHTWKERFVQLFKAILPRFAVR